MRRVFALLIGIAVTIVLFRVLTAQSGPPSGEPGALAGVLWALPAMAGGSAVGVALLVASASRADSPASSDSVCPGVGETPALSRTASRGRRSACSPCTSPPPRSKCCPAATMVLRSIIGGSLGFGTFRLHRHAIEHDAYRTFNLVAMLLAAGSLASMSLTPTGDWWTHNFSTLGTSDDIAAACFNIAIIVSGAGMAALSGGAHARPSPSSIRPATRFTGVMRTLISIIGLGLMGVGLVPIDGDTDLHNAFAASAAASVRASLPRHAALGDSRCRACSSRLVRALALEVSR